MDGTGRSLVMGYNRAQDHQNTQGLLGQGGVGLLRKRLLRAEFQGVEGGNLRGPPLTHNLQPDSGCDRAGMDATAGEAGGRRCSLSHVIAWATIVEMPLVGTNGILMVVYIAF